MNFAELALEQHKASAAVLTAAVADAECLQGMNKSFAYITDIASCASIINSQREKTLLDLSIKEFQFAIFTLTQGLYRQAFSALRLSFELALCAIEFSANEFALRRWEKGANDINWQRIINTDNGIFSVNFIRAFMEGIDEKGPHFRSMAEKVYRECSEYVHGNAATHTLLPCELQFSKEVTLQWCEKANTIYIVVLFAFFVRYMQDADEANRKIVENIFIDSLGHIQKVRLTFGAAA